MKSPHVSPLNHVHRNAIMFHCSNSNPEFMKNQNTEQLLPCVEKLAS
jgi:hypothetical protein